MSNIYMAFKPKLSNFTPQGKFLATPLSPNDLAIKDEQTNYNNTLGHLVIIHRKASSEVKLS